MANQTIPNLTELTTPANDDENIIVDKSDTTDGSGGTNKKISWTSIKTFLKTYFDTLYPSGSGNCSGNNTGDQTLPVKASKAEMAAGTNDAKFATALSIAEIFKLPEGGTYNIKFVPSVASNNLTVALKGLDGNDHSATNPGYVMIGGVMRSITAALSNITSSAGYNEFNAGSAELATKEIDYFVYIGCKADNSIILDFSRIPYATLGSDFSATYTNEKWASNNTVAADTVYVNIGRFAAILSAVGTGHLWTVPTFTATNLIQRPIYESRSSLIIVPTLGCGSGTITGATITNDCTYQIRGNKVSFKGRITLTNVGSGTPGGGLTLKTPFTPKQDYYDMGVCMETAATAYVGSVNLSATQGAELKTYNNGTWFANGYRVGFSIEYEI